MVTRGVGHGDLPHIEETIVNVEEEVIEENIDTASVVEVLQGYPQTDPNSVVTAWNMICGNELGKVVKLTDSRRLAIESREASFPGIDWREVFTRVAASSFLCGHSGTWKADFSWVISGDDHIAKILEGRYDDDDVAPSAPSLSAEEIAAMPDPRDAYVCSDGVDLRSFSDLDEIMARLADKKLSPYAD